MVATQAARNMAARISRPRDERGADAIEQAWAFTLMLLIGFCLVALIVEGFTGVALSTSVESAAMKADFSQAVLSTDVKTAVADEIAANSGILKREDLEVTSASVEFHETSDSASVAGRGTSASTIDSAQTTATLTCDVSCKVPTPIKVWGMGDLKVSRQVKCEVPVSMKLEVG